MTDITTDDIRAFAHSNTDAFLDFLFEDGFGPMQVAEHLEKKYAANLRDKFAMAALQGLLSNAEAVNADGWSWRTGTLAGDAYAYADDMLSCRNDL